MQWMLFHSSSRFCLVTDRTFYQPFVRLRGHTRESLIDESFDNKLGLILFDLHYFRVFIRLIVPALCYASMC